MVKEAELKEFKEGVVVSTVRFEGQLVVGELGGWLFIIIIVVFMNG